MCHRCTQFYTLVLISRTLFFYISIILFRIVVGDDVLTVLNARIGVQPCSSYRISATPQYPANRYKAAEDQRRLSGRCDTKQQQRGSTRYLAFLGHSYSLTAPSIQCRPAYVIGLSRVPAGYFIKVFRCISLAL